MNQQFIPNEETAEKWEDPATNEQDVWDMCPWANVVLPCDGGWRAFESMVDADIWRNQA